MTPHLKAYMECNKYSHPSEIICEISGKPANDIMHISPRGMGGSKMKNDCRNLMAAQRKYHDIVEKYTHLQWWFQRAHDNFRQEGEPAIVHNPTDLFLLAMHNVHAGLLLGGNRDMYLTNRLKVVHMPAKPGEKATFFLRDLPDDEENVWEGNFPDLLNLISGKMYFNVPLEAPRGVDLRKITILDLLPMGHIEEK